MSVWVLIENRNVQIEVTFFDTQKTLHIHIYVYSSYPVYEYTKHHTKYEYTKIERQQQRKSMKVSETFSSNTQ